jgi:hypothetical protein
MWTSAEHSPSLVEGRLQLAARLNGIVCVNAARMEIGSSLT